MYTHIKWVCMYNIQGVSTHVHVLIDILLQYFLPLFSLKGM